MYYHSEPLKYVKYGKIFPYESEDSWMLPAYKWLGFYCNYYPQVWLSRSHSCITGFRSFNIMKKQKNVIGNRKNTKISNDSILFGFDIIKGFDIDMELWCFLLNGLIGMDLSSSLSEFNEKLTKYFNEHLVWLLKEGYCNDEEMEKDIHMKGWDRLRDIDAFIKEYLFVENDQVVVPNLNLKSAKKIICRNEKQKKKLRKMGFIEDRIQIKNIKNFSF